MDQFGREGADRLARLLAAGDPAPVAVENPLGASHLLLLGDHAGRAIPARLGNLGLAAPDLMRHIAWDVGVAGLGAKLARRFDAPFIRQSFSRLVIDCNRAPTQDGSIAALSDATTIPGNIDLSLADRETRIREVFQPYHDRIAAELEARRTRKPATLLVSLHSFTPSMGGESRPWRFGVLHRNDSAFSRVVLAALRARFGDAVGDNQPYAMDGIDYTIPRHADGFGLDYVELEIRQDLIDTSDKQAAMVRPVAAALEAGVAAIGGGGGV